MGEQRRRFGSSCTLGPLLLAVALACGCKANDSAGDDLPADAGGSAGTGSGARDAAAAGTSAGNAGNSANAGRGGSTSGSAGRTGADASAGQGGDSAVADAGPATDGAVPPPTAQDPECDLNGVWIARLTTFSRDDVFGEVQTASNWYYYEFTHDGADVVVKDALDCGIRVSGSANVTLNRATTEALLTPNNQTGRTATFTKDGDHCALRFDRFYSVRGVPRATYLADVAADPELSAITPALPSEAEPEGSEDWDGDGSPGVAYQVEVLGTRHVAQRDWNEFFSNDDYSIALDADEFVAAAAFDSDESLLGTGGGLGALLRAGATPILDAKHRITFRRLGDSASDAAVSAVRVEDAVDSCYNVQDALPHLTASM